MTFTESIKTCLKDKYATFTGRASRSEYWWFYLFMLIIGIIVVWVCGLYDVNRTPSLAVSIPLLILEILLIIPSIAVTVRRLHDAGQSGWLWLISLIPFVGQLILLVLCILPTQKTKNKYGDIPADVHVVNADNQNQIEQ